ncbi:cytochrome P450 [Earliella scabrosa]|nr:cytochrome P450 [Earliella scabrosa]
MFTQSSTGDPALEAGLCRQDLHVSPWSVTCSIPQAASNGLPIETFLRNMRATGNILYLNSFGNHVLILNSPDVIFEFLDRRASNTSDRKQTAIIDMCQGESVWVLFPYGEKWRRHRRAFWQHFTPRAIGQYEGVQRASTNKFLLRLLREPSDLRRVIRLLTAIHYHIYDIDMADEEDPLISTIDAAIAAGDGLTPGRYLVELFPFLRHVPPWLPGAGFRKQLAEWLRDVETMRDHAYEKTKKALDTEGADCLVSSILTSSFLTTSSPEEHEFTAKNVALVSLLAGSDTVFAVLQGAFLALSLNPSVVKKAQAELDAVVGPTRLPDFQDQDSLVYVNALIKEAMRWHTVVPLCVPHMTMADDELNGYFIPAGTTVFANIWACMHDPQVYDSPDEFRPERFIRDGRLDPSVRDPADYIFGFGRRICPGRHFAETSMFITFASVLHVFDISPPVDKEGKMITIVPDTTEGLLSYPVDCRCTIKARSERAEALILAQNS